MIELERPISIFQSVFINVGTTTTIGEELDRIRGGAYKTQVLRARAIFARGDESGYKKAKSSLSAVTFAGMFKKRSGLPEAYSGAIVIDIDSIEAQLLDWKNKLSRDPFVFAVWISPSGKGLKVLVKVDCLPEEHSWYFVGIKNYLERTLSLNNIDPTGRDAARLCLSSYDPEMFLNPDAHRFSFSPEELEEFVLSGKKSSSVAKGESIRKQSSMETLKATESFLLKDTRGRNRHSDWNLVDQIIKFLRTRKLTITGSYDNWFRVALAIANTFTFDVGERLYLRLCALDGAKHDEYKSKQMIRHAYLIRKIDGVQMGTIIYLAEQVGFVRRNKATITSSTLGQTAGPSISGS